jgi:hypothetical protein
MTRTKILLIIESNSYSRIFGSIHFLIYMHNENPTLTRFFSIRGSIDFADKLKDVIVISPELSLISNEKISPSPFPLLKCRVSYLNEMTPRIFHLINHIKEHLFYTIDGTRSYLIVKSKLILLILINVPSFGRPPCADTKRYMIIHTVIKQFFYQHNHKYP